MRIRSLIHITLILAVCGCIALAQGTRADDQPLKPEQAVRLLRSVNNAQATLGLQHNVYQSLPGLLHTPQMEDFASMKVGDSGVGLLGGYKLVVVVPSGGGRYSVSLTPMQGNCGAAFFTNESGLIYAGRVIGCPEK